MLEIWRRTASCGEDLLSTKYVNFPTENSRKPSLEFAWASALPAASTARTSRRSRHIAAGRGARARGAQARSLATPERPRASL